MGTWRISVGKKVYESELNEKRCGRQRKLLNMLNECVRRSGVDVDKVRELVKDNKME